MLQQQRRREEQEEEEDFEVDEAEPERSDGAFALDLLFVFMAVVWYPLTWASGGVVLESSKC